MDTPLPIDGLPARESQPYALEKLHYASHYMHIFAVGMRNLWPRRVYLDLMAGPGRIDVEGQQYAGSPLRSMDPPFTRRLFVESELVLADALRTRLGPTAEVMTEDCNALPTIDRLRAATADALSLAFVDNLGLDVTLQTLQRLSQNRRMDLMIVFQLQEITRNVRAVMEGRLDLGPKWDAFFGTSTWRDLVTELDMKNTPASQIAEALLTFYLERLHAIGYEHTAPANRVMKNSKNGSQYRLILAAKDARATDFFKKIQRIEYSGQRGLLD